MRRWAIPLLGGLALLALACGEDATAPSTGAEVAQAETRGRHRVRASGRRPQAQPTQVRVSDIPTLDIEALDRTAGSFLAGRDPFRYGEIPRPEPKPRPAPKPVERPEPVREAPREPAAPQAPPFDYTFLGSFGSAGLRIAVFEDSLGNVINAFEGEVLEGKFKILKIGYESVDIEFVGFPDTPAERKAVGG